VFRFVLEFSFLGCIAVFLVENWLALQISTLGNIILSSNFAVVSVVFLFKIYY